MTKVDLKDAFLVVPIHPDFKKYLRFIYRRTLYQFNVLPFGLSTAPYLFTKLIKPFLSFLRYRDILCVGYIDDILIISSSFDQSRRDTLLAVTMLQKLGFIINWDKSVLTPSQNCQFLGFILFSDTLIIKLPMKKVKRVLNFASELLKVNVTALAFFLANRRQVAPARRNMCVFDDETA